MHIFSSMDLLQTLHPPFGEPRHGRHLRCKEQVNTDDGVEAHMLRMSLEKISVAQRIGVAFREPFPD